MDGVQTVTTKNLYNLSWDQELQLDDFRMRVRETIKYHDSNL